MNISLQVNKICSVITTYKPGISLVECVQRVLPQVAEVIIVDDGASADNVRDLSGWFRDISKVTVLHQPANYGIAAALNVGVKMAKDKNYDWVLTLDDDTIPSVDMVSRLCRNITRIQGPRPVGVIGMKWSAGNGAISPSSQVSVPELFDKRGIITSGSLFSISTYNAVGPFREEFFIDSVDFDFCMRARAKGYRVIQVQEHGFKHSLGLKENFKLFNFTISSESHSPSRLYYAFRNSTVLAFEYFQRDPLYACAVAYSQFKTVMRIVFLQKSKRIKLYSLIRGFVAAMKRQMGKIETQG